MKALRHFLLALHVVGLFSGDRTEACCDPEHLGRIVGVDVDPHLVLQSGDDVVLLANEECNTLRPAAVNIRQH